MKLSELEQKIYNLKELTIETDNLLHVRDILLGYEKITPFSVAVKASENADLSTRVMSFDLILVSTELLEMVTNQIETNSGVILELTADLNLINHE